jgi:hypothetical protein
MVKLVVKVSDKGGFEQFKPAVILHFVRKLTKFDAIVLFFMIT